LPKILAYLDATNHTQQRYMQAENRTLILQMKINKKQFIQHLFHDKEDEEEAENIWTNVYH